MDNVFCYLNHTLFTIVNTLTSLGEELFRFLCFTKSRVFVALVVGRTTNIFEYATDDVSIDPMLVVLRNIFGALTVLVLSVRYKSRFSSNQCLKCYYFI